MTTYTEERPTLKQRVHGYKFRWWLWKAKHDGLVWTAQVLGFILLVMIVVMPLVGLSVQGSIDKIESTYNVELLKQRDGFITVQQSGGKPLLCERPESFSDPLNCFDSTISIAPVK